jgi:hypothetical protein
MSIYEGSTVEGMMVKLKSVFIYAQKNKMIQENPFMGFTITKRVKEVEFLTQEEVAKIRCTPMPTDNLRRIRDLFLFQCYTALSYCDMAALKPSDFRKNEMGYIYIDGKRLKTKVRFIAILFEDAISIAQKYNYELPMLSNQKYNAYRNEKKNYTYSSTMADKEVVTNQLEFLKNSNMTIPDDYNTWFNIGMALNTSFGEEGRSYFHEFSKLSNKYDETECNTQYDNIVSHYEGHSEVTLGTLCHIVNEVKNKYNLKRQKYENSRFQNITCE